jgi:hypothetical protein
MRAKCLSMHECTAEEQIGIYRREEKGAELAIANPTP